MPSINELVEELSDAAAQGEEWMPALGDHVRNVPPAIVRLVEEIGSNALLAEATLHWVRGKKQQITENQLNTLYGEKYVEQLKQKLENSP